MGAGIGLGDAEFGTDFRERPGKQGLVVPGDIAVALQAALNGRGEEFSSIGGYRAYKLAFGTTSECGRYVKSLGEPVAGTRHIRLTRRFVRSQLCKLMAGLLTILVVPRGTYVTQHNSLLGSSVAPRDDGTALRRRKLGRRILDRASISALAGAGASLLPPIG